MKHGSKRWGWIAWKTIHVNWNCEGVILQPLGSLEMGGRNGEVAMKLGARGQRFGRLVPNLDLGGVPWEAALVSQGAGSTLRTATSWRMAWEDEQMYQQGLSCASAKGQRMGGRRERLQRRNLEILPWHAGMVWGKSKLKLRLERGVKGKKRFLPAREQR